MLKKNLYWNVLLAVIALIVIVCGSIFGVKIFRYAKLNEQVPGVVDFWSVKELQDSKFFIIVKYHYKVSGHLYEGEHVFLSNPFLNVLAAQNALELWRKREWKIWCNHAKPAYSSMQKMFPVKAAVHFFLSMLVFLYFSGLKIYLQSRLIA